MRQAVRGLSAAWTAIADPEDVILVPEPVLPDDLADLGALGRPLPRFVPLPRARKPNVDGELVPWGCSASASKLAQERGWQANFPPQEVVRQANSRQQRFELEQQLYVALPRMELVESLTELEKVVAASGDLANGWILKANFGMAGRESVRGHGMVLSQPNLNWARARLTESGCVIFEPMVKPIAEAGIQVEVPRTGPPRLMGIVPQLVGPGGTYRGSRFGNLRAETDRWQPAVPTALTAATKLQELGYFGPLGIDAMWYRDADGQAHLRPLQDVNARFTMGRLALGWSRWLPTGWCGSWVSSPAAAGKDAGVKKVTGESTWDPADVRIVETLPASWKVERSGATLILAVSPVVRAEVERCVMQIRQPAD